MRQLQAEGIRTVISDPVKNRKVQNLGRGLQPVEADEETLWDRHAEAVGGDGESIVLRFGSLLQAYMRHVNWNADGPIGETGHAA